jgi:hypothetical protein
MSKLVMHCPLTFDLLSHHINVAINITVARLAPVIGDPPMHSPKVNNYGWIGQQPSSGFIKIARPTLGVFASLDRF